MQGRPQQGQDGANEIQAGSLLAGRAMAWFCGLTALATWLVAAAPADAAKVSQDGGADPDWVETIETLTDSVPDDPPPPPDTSTGYTGDWGQGVPHLEWASVIVDCSVALCLPEDQQLVQPAMPANQGPWPSSVDESDAPVEDGYRMFDERNFDPIFDAFGRERRFYVHLPSSYDSAGGSTAKLPLVFVFHGGVTSSEPRGMMIVGKWDEYFEGDVAFVIPKAEKDPCNVGATGKYRWLWPGVSHRGDSQTGQDPVNCPSSTRVYDDASEKEKSYWNASLPETFSDVKFVTELREMLLDRFPKLDRERVYATGFSSGGNFTFTLACYRSGLFAGYSMVASPLGRSARGDYLDDGVDTTDSESLIATCGHGPGSAQRALGLVDPHVWGEMSPFGSTTASAVEVRSRQSPAPTGAAQSLTRTARISWTALPVVLFVGDQDVPSAPGGTVEETMADILATSQFVRAKNNLSPLCLVVDPFNDVEDDGATTQRCSFRTPSMDTTGYAPFRRYLVRGETNPEPLAGNHGMPDADECRLGGSNHMTCDFDYTAETLRFFEQHADF